MLELKAAQEAKDLGYDNDELALFLRGHMENINVIMNSLTSMVEIEAATFKSKEKLEAYGSVLSFINIEYQKIVQDMVTIGALDIESIDEAIKDEEN